MLGIASIRENLEEGVINLEGKERPQNKYLIDLRDRTPEERKKISQMGNKKSQEIRQRKKTLKEYLELALSIEDDTGEDKYTKIVKALINEAEDGNVKAFETIRDSIGQKPKEEVEQKQEIKVVMEDNISKWGS